jgi:fibronectin type 3 domain-containing protein
VENCGLESSLPDDFARLIERPQAPRGLKVTRLSESEIGVSWQETNAPHFHHYNLYCGERPDFVPSREHLIASPTTNSFLDWGLKPDTTYYYKATVVDKWENQSPALEVAKAKTT